MKQGERGFTLIATGIACIVLVGATGLAFDVGRLYIAKNEVQAFVDAAALSAAQQLDGNVSGINAARTAAQNTLNRWNLNTQQITTTEVDFAMQPASGGAYAWVANPNPAANYTTVRVSAAVPVEIFFMKVLVPGNTSNVQATAIAAQALKTTWRQGLFPFSPFGHLWTIGAAGMPAPCSGSVQAGANCQDTTSGLVVGRHYTLRWPGNPQLGHGQNGNGSNMCPGDRNAGQRIIDIANSAGSSERGYIEEGSASVIRQTIVNDYQSVTRVVGDLVTMTDGAMQSQLDSLQSRIAQDTDRTSMNGASYAGNGRRIVACLINDGQVVNGNQFRAIQVGAFLLLPEANYGNGGNQAWCAEYMGPYVLGGRGNAAGSLGGYVVRLME